MGMKEKIKNKFLDKQVSRLKESGQLDGFKKVFEHLSEDQQQEINELVKNKDISDAERIKRMQQIFIMHVGVKKMRRLIKK